MLNPMRPGTVDRGAAEQISKTWWVVLISGIVTLVTGVVILSIQWTAEDLALVVAVLFIVRGVLQALSRPIEHTGRVWNVFVGVLEMLVGVAFISWPGPTLHVLAIFIGAWIVVSGVFHVLGALSNRHDGQSQSWWVFLVFGLIEVPIGIVLLARPIQTLGLAIAMVGLWAVVAGAFQVVVSLEVKRLPEIVGDDSDR